MDKNVQEIVSSIIKDFGQDKLKEVCQLILDQGLRRIPNLEPSTAKKDNPIRLAQLLCKAAGENILEVLAELNQTDRVETAYCPFCGAEVEFLDTEYDSEGGVEEWYCPECHAHGRNTLSAPQFLEYDELYDGDGNPVDPDDLPDAPLSPSDHPSEGPEVGRTGSETEAFDLDQAYADVEDYLEAQDPEFFSSCHCCKWDVLDDEHVLDTLAKRHYRAVTQGKDRQESVREACNHIHGILKA